MAVGKKITQIMNSFDFDRFDGWGTLEVSHTGLKYISFFVSGDWKHMHMRFTNHLEALATKFNITVKQVDFKMTDECGDWYAGFYKFLVE